MVKTPYIGQMDRLIKVYQEEKTRNNQGEQKSTLKLVASPYAFMEETSGDEDVEGKIRHLISRKYTIRYNKDIATNGHKYKIEDGTLTYEVYHVKQIGRKQHLQLLVTNYE